MRIDVFPENVLVKTLENHVKIDQNTVKFSGEHFLSRVLFAQDDTPSAAYSCDFRMQ